MILADNREASQEKAGGGCSLWVQRAAGGTPGPKDRGWRFRRPLWPPVACRQEPTANPHKRSTKQAISE